MLDIKMYKKLSLLITSLSLVIILGSCSSSNSYTTNNTQSIGYYQAWVRSLLLEQYGIAEGNAYLMQNVDCPTFVAIFNSCFGQNPAAPYIIPQPPIGNSYVDPYYATALETPGPNGMTDILYRLSDNDALITIIAFPPTAAYFGYQSYLFTSNTSNYTGITPNRSRTISPDPSRYDIFGSMGNDVNNVIVQNQYGITPWDGKVVMYITTSNKNLANTLITNAKNRGINPNSIFVEPVGSNVITGNSSSADDLITLIRYSVPKDPDAATAWINNVKNNVLVYKVTNANINITRFGTNQYTPHEINNNETTLNTALQQLTTLLQNYLQQTETTEAISYQTQATTSDNANGVPTDGLVGSNCILYGTDCEGDNQDTSTYATLIESSVILAPTDTAFIAGVNHSDIKQNNNIYLSVDIYNAADASGVASSSQTNVTALGFNSGNLTGSAAQILTLLGIEIPVNDIELTENISRLYATFVTRDCSNQTIKAANKYCINLKGTSLIPLTAPISITERSYIVPGTTTGGYVPEMVYPYIIAAKHNFITNP